MKIVDEKGKLFGLVNLIDLLVVLVLVAVVFGGVKRLGSRPAVSDSSSKGIVTYEIKEVRQVTVDNIVVGDPIYHYDKGTYIGTIVDKKVEPFKDYVEYNGQWVNAEKEGRYVVTIEVEADVKESTENFVVGGEQTRVGVEQRLKNKRAAYFGNCLGIELK